MHYPLIIYIHYIVHRNQYFIYDGFWRLFKVIEAFIKFKKKKATSLVVEVRIVESYEAKFLVLYAYESFLLTISAWTEPCW